MNCSHRLILMFLIVLITSQSAFARVDKDFLSDVESRLYGRNYQTETVDKRLSRLEFSLFGKKNYFPTNKRFERIKETLGIAQELSPPAPKNKPACHPQDFSRYPAISKLENSIYSKSFENEDVYKRLERLEKELFNTISSKPLADRVDKLKDVIEGQNAYIANTKGITRDLSKMQTEQALNILETNTFNVTYLGEATAKRLERLEKHYFKTTSPNDNTDYRIERLAVVSEAKKGSELCTEASQIRKYQDVTKGVTIAGVALLILKAFLF